VVEDGSSIPEYDDDDDVEDAVSSRSGSESENTSRSGGKSGLKHHAANGSDPGTPTRRGPRIALLYTSVFLMLVAIIGGVWYFMFPNAQVDVPDEEKPIKVLIIGNDTLHINDVPNMLREVANMSKSWRPLEVTCLAKEDYSLAQHLQEKDAEALIKEQRWDFVVLQDRWLQPLQDPSGMLDSVRTLSKAARDRGSRVVLFVPWADSGENERQEVLSAVSRKLAERLSIDVAPAGDVLFAVSNKHKEIQPYVADKHHVSSIGAWLAAAALYSVLTNQKPKLIAEKFLFHGNDGDESHIPVTGDLAIDVETQVWQTINEENPGRKLGLPVKNAEPARGLEL